MDRNDTPLSPARDDGTSGDRAAPGVRGPLARVIAQFPGAIAVFGGPQHVFRAISAAYSALIGHRSVIGLPIREALPDLDGQGFFELLDQAYTTGEPASVQAVPVQWDFDGDGLPELGFIDCTYQPLLADDGTTEGIIAFIADVTRGQVALSALAASESRYRLAVDAAQLGTWTLDMASGTAVFDERVGELLAAPDDRAMSLADILDSRVHPSDRDRVVAALGAASDPTGDGRFGEEYRLVHPDGTERWVLALARMHFREDRTPRVADRLVGTVLDITDRKHAEARQRVLARLADDVMTAGDEQVALQRLVDSAVAELADWAIVDVIEPGGVARRAAMAHADPEKLAVMREMSRRYPPDVSRPTLGRDALATGRAQLYADVDDALVTAMTHDAEQARLARSMGARSAMVVPLQTREGPFGVVAFGSGRRSFTPDDVAVAAELGRRASLAVENARLVAAARRAQDEATAAAQRTVRLQALSAALASALTPNDVAEAAVREGVGAVGADAGVLVLVAPDGETVTVIRSVGYEDGMVTRWQTFPLSATVPLTDAIRANELVVVESTADRERRYPRLDDGQTIRYPASISVPLMAEGRSFGALGLSFQEPITVRPEDRELLLAVARQCAQALRRATLFEAEAVAREASESAGRRLAFLAEASAALASLDYETTLQRVAQLAVPTLADYVVIDLVDEQDNVHRVASAHVNPAQEAIVQATRRHYPRAARGLHPVRAALAGGEPLLVAEVTDPWVESIADDPDHLAQVRALRPRSLMVVPLVARGHTLGVMSFAMSESDRVYGAEDLALATELARRAAVAVDNARLFRESESARRDAEAASRAKGQFLAVMSHELRTPLNAILGYGDLVEMGVHGPVTDAQREAMKRIRRSGQHLLSLVNNVLNLERAEVGTLETDLVALSVADLFQDADALSRPLTEAKGISLTVEPPPADVTVLGERDKVGQVLVNLLTNAVKFTRTGGTISLTARVGDEDVALEVRDTGVGIPAEALERIFDPFVQLDSGLTRSAEGAGLGLAISRRLARLMGGDLNVTSVPGNGSAFTLTLVRIPPEDASA